MRSSLVSRINYITSDSTEVAGKETVQIWQSIAQHWKISVLQQVVPQWGLQLSYRIGLLFKNFWSVVWQ
jgi:hypothetical protein